MEIELAVTPAFYIVSSKMIFWPIRIERTIIVIL